MPTPTKGARLGGTPAHERIILANLASQLFEHGRITTTEAKAKRVRPLAERLITKAKKGDLHSRRQVLSTIGDKSIVHTLFAEIAPTMADRDGGYLRITKIGPRKGDNAPMAIIEIITDPVAKKPAVKAAEPAQAVAAPAEDDDTTANEAGSEADDSAKYGEGSFQGEEPPAGFDIKGNEDSMKFHTPESPWYDRTGAEVWFNSTEAAEAAGFVNAVKSDEEKSDEEKSDEDKSDEDVA